MKANQEGLWLFTLALGTAVAAVGAGAPGRTSSVTGTVGRVDPAARSLDVAGRGGTRSFTIPAAAVVLRQTTIPLSALRVGDTITVSGVPRQIQALAIDTGEAPASGLQARLTRAAPGIALPPAGQPGSAAAPPRRSRPRAARVRVSGTVAATAPALLLRLADGSNVQIAPAVTAVVHRLTPATLTDLKPGERVRVVTDPATGLVREVLVGLRPPRRITAAPPRRGKPLARPRPRAPIPAPVR